MKRYALALLIIVAVAPYHTAEAQVAHARYGWAGDVSETHAIVAAPFRDHEQRPDVGAITFYKKADDWEAIGEVIHPSGSVGSLFGYSVAMDGEWAVIGAPGDAENGLLTGAAYVYQHVGEEWVPIQKLVAESVRLGARLGQVVEVKHGVIAVSSWAGCGDSKKGGCVYLFEQRNATWETVARLALPNASPDAAFGSSIQIADANTVIVGAPTSGSVTERAGEVYVFSRGGDTWQVTQRIHLADGQMGDLFGESIAYANGHLFVGSPGRRVRMHSGAVYAYRKDNGVFIDNEILESVIDEDHVLFGQSLSLENGLLLVGAPRKNASVASDVGDVYIYEVGETIVYVGNVGSPDNLAEAGFGYHVRTDGAEILIGAPFCAIDDVPGAGRAFFHDPGSLVLTEVIEVPDIPTQFALYENYPNPFNPSTTVQYALPREAHVRITVFNVLGQRVALLVDQQQIAGVHEVVFHAKDLPSGVYFYEMEAGVYRKSQKMTLLK